MSAARREQKGWAQVGQSPPANPAPVDAELAACLQGVKTVWGKPLAFQRGNLEPGDTIGQVVRQVLSDTVIATGDTEALAVAAAGTGR